MDGRKVHLYLYTFCRYFLATIIISYAFSKILGTQFITQPSVYDKPIGSLSGFQLTWYYFGYSNWYGLVIGFTQILSSILLFFRKTTRIGVIIFLTFMVNILLMDFAYDIQGAKGMALTLTLMGLFVLLSDHKVLIKYFIQEPPLFYDVEQPNWIKKIHKVKYIYIPLVFILFFVLFTTLKEKYMGQNKFYGAWENIDTSERLYFEAGNTFQIIKNKENSSYEGGEYIFTNDSIKFQKKSDNEIKSKNKIDFISGKYKLSKNHLIITTKDNQMKFNKIR